MKNGIYIGPDPSLKDKTALIRESSAPNQVMAQFDDMVALPLLARGWHPYDRSYFEIVKNEGEI